MSKRYLYLVYSGALELYVASNDATTGYLFHPQDITCHGFERMYYPAMTALRTSYDFLSISGRYNSEEGNALLASVLYSDRTPSAS